MGYTMETFVNPPRINKYLAIALFIVNILIPGGGTMVVGGHKSSCEYFIIGLLQLVLSGVAIGWVWSIIWGWKLFSVSKADVEIPEDNGSSLIE